MTSEPKKFEHSEESDPNAVLLGADDILNADDLTTRDVKVPEWSKNAVVRIRTLTGAERDAYETSMVKMKKDGSTQDNRANVRARLVAASCVNAQGEKLFSGAAVVRLGQKSSAALQRVCNAAQELSDISDDLIEELADSFETTPDEGSATA